MKKSLNGFLMLLCYSAVPILVGCSKFKTAMHMVDDDAPPSYREVCCDTSYCIENDIISIKDVYNNFSQKAEDLKQKRIAQDLNHLPTSTSNIYVDLCKASLKFLEHANNILKRDTSQEQLATLNEYVKQFADSWGALYSVFDYPYKLESLISAVEAAMSEFKDIEISKCIYRHSDCRNAMQCAAAAGGAFMFGVCCGCEPCMHAVGCATATAAILYGGIGCSKYCQTKRKVESWSSRHSNAFDRETFYRLLYQCKEHVRSISNDSLRSNDSLSSMLLKVQEAYRLALEAADNAYSNFKNNGSHMVDAYSDRITEYKKIIDNQYFLKPIPEHLAIVDMLKVSQYNASTVAIVMLAAANAIAIEAEIINHAVKQHKGSRKSDIVVNNTKEVVYNSLIAVTFINNYFNSTEVSEFIDLVRLSALEKKEAITVTTQPEPATISALNIR